MNALLAWLMSEDTASEILGDLAEQRERRAGSSRMLATFWFWRALMGVALFISVRRAQDAVGAWVRGGLGLGGGMSDVSQAARRLWRAPWYSTTAIGVIAVGMSLATTAFAVVDGVLFKSLPYRAPSQLYLVSGAFSKLAPTPGKPRVTTPASTPDFESWSAVSAPATLAGFDASGPVLPLGNDLRLRVANVTSGFLDVLGVTPLMGGFRDEHFRDRAAIRPVLITYDLWQRYFEGEMPIVGRIAGPPESRVEIAGVMPKGFAFPATSRRLVPDVIAPIIRGEDDANVRARWITVIGRIPSGVTATEIEARLTGAAQRLAETWPAVRLPANATESMRIMRGPADMVTVRPLKEALTFNEAGVSRIVFAAAAFLVFLSALTVAGLTASRLEDRRSELAMRRALGGSAARITRLLAAESAVIVLAGAALGWLLASPLLRVTLALMPPGLMFLKPPVLDARVLLFGTLASMTTTALVTAWASRSTRTHTLTGEFSTARATPGRSVIRARSVLIASQVAVAVVMVVAGVLLTASLARVWQEDPGFNPDNAATIRVDEREDATGGTMKELLQTLKGLPGVTVAAGLGNPFLDNAYNGNGFESPVSTPGDLPAEGLSVTGGFFEAAGLRALQGRLPSDDELDRGDPVIVVSEHVARTYWPGQPAVGQRLKKDDNGRDFEVVGVVPDARYRSLDRDPDGAIYSPLAADQRWTLMNVIVRFSGDAASRLPALTEAMTSRFPMYGVRSTRTVTASLGESIRARRFQTWLFAAFGLGALALTGAGILGVMAMTTARRTREVGIRMAIGATRTDVVSHLLGEQLLTVTIGMLAGAAIAVWAARFVRAFVYKLDVYDPVVWTLALVTILATAIVGTLIPASRASRVDPVKALRAD